MLSDHQLWREDGEDGYSQVSEALEKFVVSSLSVCVFCFIIFVLSGFCCSVSTTRFLHLLTRLMLRM